MNDRFFIPCLLAWTLSTSAHAADPVPVKTVAPQPATAARTMEIPGRTEPLEEAKIYCRATGIVRERMVDIGDAVKAGDVLAIIDAPEIDRQVEAAEATVDQAAVKARTARSVSDRSSALVKSRAVSIEDADQLASTADQLDAALRFSKAELARLQEIQRFATVRAPFDATIAARNIDRGAHVNGDSSNADAWLFHLVGIKELRVVIEATPDLALRILDGSEAAIRFPDFPGKSFPAKVTRTSHSIERASGTMRVELLLKNEDRVLPSGLTGIAAFTLMPAPGTFLLPTNTLVSRNGKPMVALVDLGKAKFIEVGQGRNLGEVVEVTSPALENATVIVSPNAMLREGDAVEATALPSKAKP